MKASTQVNSILKALNDSAYFEKERRSSFEYIPMQLYQMFMVVIKDYLNIYEN